MYRFLCVLLSLLGLTFTHSARAGDFCVDTVAELVQAIGQFESAADGQVVSIKVVQGTYLVNEQLADHDYTSDGREVGLKILGGYTANCAGRTLNPANTVIDGNNRADSGITVVFSDDAAAYIEGLTFTRFATSPDVAGGALALITEAGAGDASYIAIRHCRFIRNSGPHAAWISAAQMRFVNNLVVDNTLAETLVGQPSAVWIAYDYDASSGAAVNNNTIANNHGGSGLRFRSDIDPSARTAEISNNILWGNDGGDLHLAEFNSLINILFVNGNLIGSSVGTVPAGTGNNNSNPAFVNPAALNFGLALNSPAINSGINYQTYGIPDVDMVGNDRVIGSSIDRGAFESSVDDFTTAFVTSTADNGNNTTPSAGSLRAAIKAANAASGPYSIKFELSGACPRIINLTTTMLDITGKVTIDARTQNGWNANTDYGHFDASLCVVLNGSGFTTHAFRVPSLASSNASLTVHGMMFAGFTDAAIRLDNGRDHRISGNQFGAVPFTSANGSAVRVSGASRGAFIGGFDDPAAVNLIAGSSVAGVYLENVLGGNTVANNVIGFQPDGLTPATNDIGVFVFNSPQNSLAYNYIAHSDTNGVTISGAASSGTQLYYNSIGADWTGGVPGNGGAGVGIIFGAQNSTIGAPLTSTFGGNLIARNLGPGVWISPSGGSGNRVLSNQFFDNQGVDIDFGTAGPTPNQASNPGTGPNHLQNYPVLASAVRGTAANPATTIGGNLHSAPNSSYRIDIYAGTACDGTAAGRGTAELFLGRSSVTTNGSGDVVFNFAVTTPGSLNFDTVSATATSAGGDTSELGNCIALVPGNLPNAVFANGFE